MKLDAGTQTMTAIVQDEYGSAPEDVLRVAHFRRPAPGDGEVLVRVRAASVDRGTWHLMAGLPYPVRVAGFGVRRPKALNPGRCLAGVVVATGPNVTGLSPGDAVFGTGTGSFAEFAVAPAGRVTAKPVNLSYGQAAAVPVSAATALQAIRDNAHLAAGQHVLIVGASGGVGTFAVQIAKAYGAEVTGVCRTEKADLVRSIGAEHVIDYTREDFADGARRYDAIVDIGGNTALSRLRRALAPGGRLVIVGGETDGRWLGGTDRQIRARMLSPFVRQTLTTFITSENADDLRVLRDFIEAGRITPVVGRSYPLNEVAAAVRHLLDGQARGKIVIDVAER